jgi:CrcB protein
MIMKGHLYLMVGLGSAAGGLLRRSFIGIEEFLGAWIGIEIEFSTLIVNVLGSFGIGLVAGLSSSILGTPGRLFFGAGMCGGFTALSSFSVETMLLLRQGDQGQALLNVLISTVSGFAAAATGLMIGRLIGGS